jgi:protein-L-isoaspartate(D-aspartate) O-methyltransferase
MASDRNRVPVAEAFAAVPRAPFLPATERTLTECNVPVAIGHGQTNSQPSTVADMLELLDVRLGDRVLDLGAGSGWTTALLSVLVGAQGAGLGCRNAIEDSSTRRRRFCAASTARTRRS